MRKTLLWIAPFIFALSIAITAADKPKVAVQDPQKAYTGLNRCKMCHRGEKNGNMFEIWEASQHAKAYQTLLTDQAKEVYAKTGKEGKPEEDAACLKCHVTGHNVSADLTKNIKFEEGISCETCHFAGNDYWPKNVMENYDEAVKKGMNPDPKSFCITCHNAESPTFKGFDFDTYWKKIEHKVPPRQ